jgi:hypothetical protein
MAVSKPTYNIIFAKKPIFLKFININSQRKSFLLPNELRQLRNFMINFIEIFLKFTNINSQRKSFLLPNELRQLRNFMINFIEAKKLSF